MSALPTSLVHPQRRTRVLIVDDSAVVREVLSRALSSCPDMEVVGTAPDPFVARDKILKLQPDVLTLDLEMPKMDGLTFLRKLMAVRPMPVVVVSSLTTTGARATLEALEAGAVEVLAKPAPDQAPEQLAKELALKVRQAAASRPRSSHTPAPAPGPRLAGGGDPAPVTPAAPTGPIVVPNNLPWKRLVALGASTGGVQALTALLTRFPERCPPTVVVQHMPPHFTANFADRLNQTCACRVSEAREGDVLREGHVLLAPGGRHMTIRREANSLVVSLKDGPPVFHQRPAVEVLFDSVTRLAGNRTAAAILTGMGADGAAALLRLRQAGARTIAEHESTAIVYGMPAEAVRLGAAEQILPLPEIAGALLQLAAEA